MRTIMIVCALVLGFVSLGRVSAGDNKVDICHYQEENDRWKLLSVGQPAAGAHLEHHDDALPGGTTSQTGTVLDADCEEVEVTCPCDFSLNAWFQLGIETDITCFVGGTIAAPLDSFIGEQNFIGTYINGFISRRGFFCGIIVDGETDGIPTEADESSACEDAIIEVADALDPPIICSFP